MSLSKELLIQKALDEFPAALKSSLPLDHFSQFHDGPHFDKLAKQISKEILLKVQANSELEVEDSVAVASELRTKFQEIIRGWRATNEENKTHCDHFLQSQVDFLHDDFRTSVMIKLVSSPDVELQELETFLEQRKVVLIDIFDKLSKPGDQQSNVIMKTKLNEILESVKMETVEKQRLQLEQKTAKRALKVLEETKWTILKIASQLKSDLKDYQGSDPKELVKTKLREINYFLNLKKKGCPIYRCNVCCRNCRQSMLRYHGAYCGKSDDPLTYKECGKTFMNKAHLDTHARIHTGEKPFKCSKCSKGFSVKGNLQKHVCSHGREARYMCEPCQLTFSSNLRLHEHKNLKHKAELPFGCLYCEERFDTMYKLKHHVITHTDIRPFRCPTCDLSAPQSTILLPTFGGFTRSPDRLPRNWRMKQQ